VKLGNICEPTNRRQTGGRCSLGSNPNRNPYYRYGASKFAKWLARAMYVRPINEMAMKMQGQNHAIRFSTVTRGFYESTCTANIGSVGIRQ
jgi:hypothetical protein